MHIARLYTLERKRWDGLGGWKGSELGVPGKRVTRTNEAEPKLYTYTRIYSCEYESKTEWVQCYQLIANQLGPFIFLFFICFLFFFCLLFFLHFLSGVHIALPIHLSAYLLRKIFLSTIVA